MSFGLVCQRQNLEKDFLGLHALFGLGMASAWKAVQFASHAPTELPPYVAMTDVDVRCRLAQ